MASLFGLRGDVDRAASYLTMAIAQAAAFNVARAKIDPDFDPVRDELEFLEALESATSE